MIRYVWAEGAVVEEGLKPIVYYNLIAGDYFRAMGIPLKRGRFPTREEMWQDREVVLINEAMADRVFPGVDALNKRFKTGKDGRWLTVIGVVGDVHQEGLDRSSKSEFYVPFSSMPMPFLTLVASMHGSASEAGSRIRQIVQQGHPWLALPEIATLDEVASATVAHRRLALVLLGLFAALALALAGIGIYGVISYVVTQSTSEMGARMALGATRMQIIRLIGGKGLRTAAAGALTGLLLSAGVARLLSALLYEVSAFDPAIYAIVPVVVLAATVAACLIPALRASKADPLAALRHE